MLSVTMNLSLFVSFLSIAALIPRITNAQGPQLILAPCSPDYSRNQLWFFNSTDTRLYLKHKVGNQLRCMDIDDYSTQDNATVSIYDS